MESQGEYEKGAARATAAPVAVAATARSPLRGPPPEQQVSLVLARWDCNGQIIGFYSGSFWGEFENSGMKK